MLATLSRPPAGATIIAPQRGFQTRFLSSRADITVGGGSAGCGKTRGAIMGAARWVEIPSYSAVFFRRTTTQIKNPGGLWDEARKVYPLLGAVPHGGELEWRWPSTAKIKMAHLEHESTIYNWQGAQVPTFCFDELTHFLSEMFWYFLSRNRSTCGVRSRILATCNPDADSWVAELLAWWIDQNEHNLDGSVNVNYGMPIPERAGVLRYFTRVSGELVWGDTRQEVIDQAPGTALDEVRSLTFIPGKLEDNRLGDPRYRGQLMAMSRVQRSRLLDGNWKVKATSGDFFKRSEVKLLDEIPNDVVAWVRRWDLAATEPGEQSPDPDWTVGVLMGRRKDGQFVVADAIMVRKRSDEVRALVRRTAENDGTHVRVGIPQDPGQAGVDQVKSYSTLLAGYPVFSDRETGDKVTRADPFAAQWQRGNVAVVRGAWNGPYFTQMEGFPSKGLHDDAVDASAGAFTRLLKGRSVWDVL